MDEHIARRKDEHIDVVLERDVGSAGSASGLGGWTLEFDALPELDLDQVDLSCEVLGKSLRAPILIGSMTGGTDRTRDINYMLARAAARVGVGMALGSQRAMYVYPETTDSYCVKKAAPDLPLLMGNIGAVQLNYGVEIDDINTLVEAVEADGLFLHLNPLQEAIQPEGDTSFAGLMPQLAELIPQVAVPCVAKEVGGGLGARTLSKLATLPLAGVETAGVGGTSWARVESHRAGEDSARGRIGRRLAGFGVPTATSIHLARQAMPDRLVIGSGGMRTGLDMAIGLALGADICAFAKPLLEAAMIGEDAVVEVLEEIILELRIVMFCCGAGSVAEMRGVQVFPPGRGPA